jgi:hypothetical protein
MFQRALKLKFNQQKFVQTSLKRLQRAENERVSVSGKRVALLGGMCFLPVLVKWYRKAPTHKVCYAPMRKGLHQLKNDPYYQAMEKGEVYGEFYGPKGRPHL